MYNNNKILVVIPARGGSKRIPRKNTRLLADKPLISYSIEMANASEYVDDVVISTEDSEISFIAEKLGVSVIRRPEELAGDDSSLDPVVFDAMVQKEKQTFDEYDIVITVQPNAPLLKTETLNKAIEKFDDFSIDSVIAVCDNTHLNWGYDANHERYFPQYIERVDRQLLPKSFKETGAFLATRRHFVTENSRLGTNIDVVELSAPECVNIVNYEDLWVAENYLQKKKIAFVVTVNDEVGIDNVYRCMSVASKLISDDVLFFLDENQQSAIDLIGGFNYPYKTYDGFDDLMNVLGEFAPEIVLNDISNSSEEYISNLKNEGYFVCNFEDLGEGSEIADVVFDDLYEHDLSEENTHTGYRYYILKNGFFFQPPKVITQDVNNVLINFGPNDSNNFTEKVLESLVESTYEKRIDVVVGNNFPIEDLISKYEHFPSIQIYSDVSKISDLMFKADIIFTSVGKVMYDACSLGIPTICLCQDEREKNHIFANFNNGFINMGLGELLTKSDIISQFNDLVLDYDMRLEMHKKMLRIDLKHGFENIKSVIDEEYRKFVLNK